MREMGWSWQALQDTPAYVTRYCTDLMHIRLQAEANQAEREREKSERGY